MRPLRPVWLVVVVVLVGLLGFGGTELASRSALPTPVLPGSALASMGVIGLVTLVLGVRVLRWRQGRKTRMIDPILAARTLVLAHACAYAGSVLLGWHAGVLADQLPVLLGRLGSPLGLRLVGMLAGGVAMVAIGFIVERFCRIPPEDAEGVAGEGRTTPTRGTPDTEGGLV